VPGRGAAPRPAGAPAADVDTGGSAGAEAPAEEAPVEEAPVEEAPAAPQEEVIVQSAPAEQGEGGDYTVQAGDTLSGIAADHDTTWERIYADNEDVIGDDPNLILPGQQLALFYSSCKQTDTVPLSWAFPSRPALCGELTADGRPRGG
jgi:nucleoid-associated protein YgaU